MSAHASASFANSSRFSAATILRSMSASACTLLLPTARACRSRSSIGATRRATPPRPSGEFASFLTDIASAIGLWQLRKQERFHRRDFGHMDLQMTIEDPKMYTKPLTIKVTELLLPALARSGWLPIGMLEHGPFGIGDPARRSLQARFAPTGAARRGCATGAWRPRGKGS